MPSRARRSSCSSSTVKTRPRSRRARRAGRGARCRRRAIPFPTPGDDDADRGNPDVRRARPPRRCRPPSARARAVDATRARGARSTTPTRRLPNTSPKPALASSSPKPKSPASNETLASDDLGHVHARVPSMPTFQAMSTVSSAREPKIEPQARGDVVPVALAHGMRDLEQARRDPQDQQRREEERDRVDHVRRVRARRGDEDAAGERADHGRQRVGRLEQALRARQLRVLDEVRQARVDGRPEEAGREPGDARRARRSASHCRRTGARRRRVNRTRSAATITRRRERRSTSGAASRPIAIAGRKSAIRSAATHVPECVRSQTSRLSATNASHVPKPEPNAARKSRRSGRTRRSRSSCLPNTRCTTPENTPSTVVAEVRGS